MSALLYQHGCATYRHGAPRRITAQSAWRAASSMLRCGCMRRAPSAAHGSIRLSQALNKQNEKWRRALFGARIWHREMALRSAAKVISRHLRRAYRHAVHAGEKSHVHNDNSPRFRA